MRRFLIGESLMRQADVAAGSVMSRWPDIVGEQVAGHSEPVAYEDGVLTVRADSTAWATQLRLLTSTILGRLAEEVGLPVVVSSALESSVGLADGIALAAALPELPYACGLATAHLLTDDTVVRPLVPVGGSIGVRRPVVAPAALARTAASDDVAAAWRDRLERCAAVLGEDLADVLG